MKNKTIMILGIIAILLLVVPVQARSSYVEKCYWNKMTVGNTDVIKVEIYNPSSKTENVCIDCRIRYTCVMPGSYEIEKSSFSRRSDCQEIKPGEHTTIKFITRASGSIPYFCVVDTDNQECTLTGCPLCFIATAAYGTPTAKEIDILRDFRDAVLMENSLGKGLVEFYYAVSPPLADIISEHELLRTFVREIIIDPIVMIINETKDYWRE